MQDDARISWRELGEVVHLSPTSAADRVRRMERAGVIDGYTVRAAATGAEAVEIMRAEPAGFRVVLLDNHLGDMRGIDLLDVIAALPYDPRVVIVTGEAEGTP